MIANLKVIATRSVSLISAVLGGWVTSAIISVPIANIETAALRPCEENACGELVLVYADGRRLRNMWFQRRREYGLQNEWAGWQHG